MQMTPQGYFITMTKALKRCRRAGDGKALRAYVESWAFVTALEHIAPSRRHTVLEMWAQADATCRRRRPVPQPGKAAKANWRDAAFLAKFLNGCARGLDNDDLARLCKITPGAAKNGRRRYYAIPPAPIPLAA